MRGTHGSNRKRYSLAKAVFGLAISPQIVMGLAMTQGAEAQVPAVTFTQTNGLCGVGSGGCGDFSATGQHLAANSRGDLFVPASGNNTQFIEEIPASGGGPVVIFTGLNPAYGGRGVFADKAGNLYYTYADNVNYSVDIVYIPFLNGSYPANSTYTGMPACRAFPVPATQAVACRVPLNYPGSLGYYVQAADVALDGSGDLYILSKYQGTCNGGPCYNMILKWDATNTFSMIAGTLPNNTGAPEFAVTNAGDVFYEDGSGNNYYYAAGTATQVSLPFYYIAGVSIDAGGNVYFTQKNGASGSAIIELPFIGGTACHGSNCGDDQYNLSYQLGGYTSDPNLGVAITGYGKVFYLGDYPNSVNTLTVGNLAFGATAVGTTSATQDLLLTFGNNNSYKTFGSFTVTEPFAVASTTCANGTTYGPYATQSCTVSVTYSASAAGAQSGSIQAFDSSGNLIGSAALSGDGAAAQLNVDPGTVAAIGSGWTAPGAIATDSAGDIFVADGATGKIYKTAAGSATRTAVVSGFAAPSGLAVDGAGNLYVADSGQVFEAAYSAGGYGTPTSLIGGLSGPSGLAPDPLGNLYVADSGNARVLLLSSSGNRSLGSIVTTVGSGFTTPVAVAIDGAGNQLYVSDSGAKKVFQIGLATGAQAAVLSGMKVPAGVAVDAGGSLFAADSGAKSIVRLPKIGGAIDPNLSLTMAPVVAVPGAIALDAAGDLYAADTADATVGGMARTLGALQFGSLNVLDSSSTVSATVSSGGTQSLVLNTPYVAATGDMSSFALQSASTCADGATLDPGTACTVAEVFSPQVPGALSETLAFASNGESASTLVLSGTGVELTKTTIALAVTSPAGAPFYGQPVVVAATVAPVVGSATGPTGTVTFYVDSVAQIPSVALTGTTAAITLTGLLGGGHTITASYSGDANYAYTASSALSVTISKSASTVTVAVAAPYSNPTAANPPSSTNPQSVTFTSVVLPALPGTPTGTVTFYNGATALGMAMVTPVEIGGQAAGQATFTANTLPLGQYAVTAVYSGDPDFVMSSSATSAPLLISNPTIAMTSSATSVTGGGQPVTLSITSIAGFNAAADLGCSGLPQYATCSFSPAYATANSTTPATVTLKVLVDQPPVIAVPSSIFILPSRGGVLLLLMIPGLLAAWGLRRAAKRGTRGLLANGLLALCVLVASCMVFVGCGTGSSGSYITPAGTTTIQVNATVSTTPPAPNPPVTRAIPLQLVID
jgi:sugar lactone lactonase YvrE